MDRDAKVAPDRPGDWVGLFREPLDLDQALSWATTPGSGAVVTFSGTVRDHSPGRPGVAGLEYEAYEEQAEPRMAAIVAEARRRWPTLERVALWHRVGVLGIGESSVLVVVSSPHRAEAFEAARYCIDTVKLSVPIWKLETWEGGQDWSAASTVLGEVEA